MSTFSGLGIILGYSHSREQNRRSPCTLLTSILVNRAGRNKPIRQNISDGDTWHRKKCIKENIKDWDYAGWGYGCYLGKVFGTASLAGDMSRHIGKFRSNVHTCEGRLLPAQGPARANHPKAEECFQKTQLPGGVRGTVCERRMRRQGKGLGQVLSRGWGKSCRGDWRKGKRGTHPLCLGLCLFTHVAWEWLLRVSPTTMKSAWVQMVNYMVTLIIANYNILGFFHEWNQSRWKTSENVKS